MAEWSPERIVDEALARRLIGAQYPELADAPMTLLGAGTILLVTLLVVDDIRQPEVEADAVAVVR